MVKSFSVPTVNHFGSGAVTKLSEELKNESVKKVFLISDRGLDSAGLVDKVKKLIEKDNIEVEKFLEVEQEPSSDNVAYCLENFKKTESDFIVAVGGGSPLDVAKAVSVLAINGGDILDYAGVGEIPKPGVKKALIPTTSGTGAEITKNAIFTDKKANLKKGVVSKYLQPDVAIIDPDLTLSVPPHVTAATGMDALTHAIEAFTSPKASIQTDMYAKKAIELIGENLRDAVHNGQDLNARENMSFASYFAGIALANAGVGGVHALAYPLGGQFGVSHGVANALLLPYVMELNIVGKIDKFAEVAELLGVSSTNCSTRIMAEKAVDAVRELSEDVEIPQNLSDLDVKEENLENLAEATMGVTRLLANNPVPLDKDKVRYIFERAF